VRINPQVQVQWAVMEHQWLIHVGNCKLKMQIDIREMMGSVTLLNPELLQLLLLHEH
jgi:hypothetical protein